MRDDELARAVKRGDVNAVERLMRAGADPNSCDIACWTPLDHAAHQGNTAMIKLLLENGADVNAGVYSPLQGAVMMNHPRAVELLIKAGAKTNIEGVPMIAYVQGSGRDANEIRKLLNKQKQT